MMGVRGLSKFVDENPHLYRNVELHNTRVVIDGCSLLHYLYAYSGANYTLGGDYDEYAVAIQKYFSFFKECGIQPIVIFDGGYNESDRMLNKLLERQKHRLGNIKKLLEEGEKSSEILPINAHQVFKNILSEMEILYAQCDYEGDNQTASIANYYGCPVISDDSDFYIYDLPHGFIRLNHIESGVKVKKCSDGSKIKYLKCSIYYVNTLLSCFPLKDKSVLFLLAVMAGNDYSSPYEEFKPFYYGMRIRIVERFPFLFTWLRFKTLDQARNEVMKFIPLSEKANIKSIIENSLEDYMLKPTNMVDILESLSTNQFNFVNKTALTAPCKKNSAEIVPLPNQFVVSFHRGMLPASLLNIITLHRNILLPQFDDFSKDSSYICSRHIRQITYGILLHHDYGNNYLQHTKSCIRQVVEYDRVRTYTRANTVELVTILRNGENVPKLNEIFAMQQDELRHFVANVLETKVDFFLDIPNNLQLLFGCLNYFLLNSYPIPPMEFIPAILLSVIYFQMKDLILEENTSARHNLPQGISISYSSAKLVIRTLEYFFQSTTAENNGALDVVRIVHSYSQFQACILDSVNLNLLTNLPFEPPKLHKLLNGTIIFKLTKKIQSRPLSISVSELLNEETAQLFNFYARKFDLDVFLDSFNSLNLN